MAKKRMFSLDVVDTDRFLDMPLTTQALYFHLGMRADDDGFVSSPKRIIATVGSNIDDLNLLIAKGYIIPFDNGVCVITDWKINNYLRPDRYTETIYKDLKATLKPSENGSFELINDVGIPVGIPDGNQTVDKRYTQYSIDKYSIDKNSIDKNREDICAAAAPKKSTPKPQRHKYGEYNNVLLNDEDIDKLKSEFPNDWQERIERLSCYIASTGKTYKNHLATIRNWSKREQKDGNAKQNEPSIEALNEKWGIHSTTL